MPATEAGRAWAPIEGLEGPIFLERASELGVDFVHVNGATGQFYFHEINGPGSALLDYDGDGDLDLYLGQGGPIESDDPENGDAEDRPSDRLYRNLLRESGRLGFEDVTEAAGIAARGYAMGVAAGDIDNDGDVDLYLANFGPDQLWRNGGDGRFELDEAALPELRDRWSTSASFFDYDADGWLDLFVAHYVDFSLGNQKPCYALSGALDYCGPNSYRPEPDLLLHNLGQGRFEDTTAAMGLGEAFGAGLGLVTADFDADGWSDVFVTNDGTDNQLWANRGGTRFENIALLAGVAYNMDGESEAGMGVVGEDLDGDADIDLFSTHLTDETHTLYLNDGQAIFTDATQTSGIGGASLAATGFGAGSLDVDHDGLLDILVVNGAVRLDDRGDTRDRHIVYAQPDQLFRNLGQARFEDVSALGGEALARPAVSRGAAFGDLDDDGDTDVIINDNRGPVRILINQHEPEQWIGLRLRLAGSGRDALGAELMAELADGQRLWRRAHNDGSHLTASDPRILLPLPNAGNLVSIHVRWPDGQLERWDDGLAGRLGAYTDLRQGEGTAIDEED